MVRKQNSLSHIFTDKQVVQKIKTELPELFEIAELECSRDGKIGMEVGSVREQILVALLVHVFGEENVKTDVPITKTEEDVRVFKKPISIKTITGSAGIKVIWTVDAQKAREFCESYIPSCDILLVIIKWDNKSSRTKSGLFLIPKFIQNKCLKQLGREGYLKMPKPGTNPRGVEIRKNAICKMLF